MLGAPRRPVGVDFYSFDFKLNHIAKHIQLPAAPTLGPGVAALPPGERLPPLLIVNIQLPTYTVRAPRDGGPGMLLGGKAAVLSAAVSTFWTRESCLPPLS